MSEMLAGKLKSPFVLVSVLYIISIFLISPFDAYSNFPINDDWIFFRQVEHMMMGNMRISAQIDPSFIIQGLMGAVWGRLYFSFVSLRILTVLVTVFMLAGVYLILDSYKIETKLKFIILLLVAFNPIVYSSSLTFMTENYFLFFFVWSLYFFLRFFSEKKIFHFFMGTAFCCFSVLVREVGLVILIAVVLAYVFSCVKSRELASLRLTLVALVPVALTYLIYINWPSYDCSPVKFIETQFVRSRINQFVQVLPYFSYFTLPILLSYTFSLPKKFKALIFVIALLVTKYVFEYDIFSLGSVFYIEGLHAKTGFRSNLSIFDNIPFKLALSYLASIGIVTSPIILSKAVRLGSVIKFFILLIFLGSLGVHLFTPDFYDRYLISSVIVFLLLIILAFSENLRLPRFVWLITIFLVFISFGLNYEYFTLEKLKWVQAYNLREEKNLNTQIFLNGTYTKYVRAQEKGDYTGLIKTMPDGLEYVCFVQDYTLDTDSVVLSGLASLEKLAERKLDNPKVYGRKKLEEIPRIKKHLDELIYNEDYFSLLYSLIGKKAFVGSYCIE